ncbi:MAG: cell wall hydrolase [Thioalkalispiraceae bacterium]|jgi:spore germination cell wall hydrolase CwlJ-like protein
MKRWLSDKLAFFRYTHGRGWLVHARYWWYTSKRERVVVGLVIVVVSTVVGATAHLSLASERERRELFCLAINIYHEARGEPKAGQYAVAEVTLNRVKSKHYPESICKVVYQKNWDTIRKRYVSAFSWTELDYAINVNSKSWFEAMNIAERVYRGEHQPRVEGALFYHARHIKPSWARKKKVKAKIGKHIFY